MTTSPTADESSQHSDLERVIAILRRRAGLIVLCFVVTAAAATGFSLLQEKQYSASASLLFRDPGFANDLFGTSVTLSSPDPTREAATNVKLVGLDVVAERTAARVRGLTTGEVASMVSVSAAGESDVVSVTATSSRPAEARRVANEFARQFIAFRVNTDKSKLQLAKRLAEREPFVENEAFRMLRASLRYFNVDHEVNSVLITSHTAGVGKSTVAWNLARVAATSSKAVLVETDLRNPSLAQQHGLNSVPGLSAVLTHQVELDEAIQTMPIVAGGNGAGGEDRAVTVSRTPMPSTSATS